jgi:hypothetical protein
MWLIALWLMGTEEPEDIREKTRPIDEAPAAAAKETRELRAHASVPVRIYIRNDMGKRFRLVEARVALDETEVVHRRSTGRHELERSFSALETAVRPGEHALRATLVYQGRNRGPRSQVENHQVRVQTSYAFDLAAESDTAAIHVVARERAGANVPLEKKTVLEVMAEPGSGVTPVRGAPGMVDAPAQPEEAAGQPAIRPALP